MKSIAEMLEAEIKASNEFSKTNFGMMIGDGFPELVREIAKSDDIVAQLMSSLMMSTLSSKSLVESVKAASVQAGNETLMRAIGASLPKHIETFRGPLEMLYWGIQIGRKLQQEEAKSLNEVK